MRSLPLVIASLLACLSAQPLLAVDDQQLRLYVNRGNAFLRAHHYAEALAEYQKALGVDPGNPVAKANITETHNSWGIYYFHLRKYKDAKQEWETCLQLDPKHANAKRNLMLLQQTVAAQGIDIDGNASSGSEIVNSDEIVRDAPVQKPGNPPAKPGSDSPVKAYPLDSFAAGTDSDAALQPSAGKAPKGVESAVESPSSDSGIYGSATILHKPDSHGFALPPGNAADSGAPESPARHFVLSNTPPDSGGDQNMSPNTVAPSAPSAPPAAILVSPGLPSARGAPSGSTVISPPPGSAGQPSSAGAVLSAPVQDSAAVRMLRPPSQPITHDNSSSQPSAPSPPKTAAFAASATVSPAGTTTSIDGSLSALEMQIFGKTNSDVPVLKRLERIEMERAGQTRQGTIIERINFLRQDFGL